MNGEMEVEGGLKLQGALVSNARKFTNLAHVSITAILVGWG